MRSNNYDTQQSMYTHAGLINLALRLVVGWTYFSAFWRRIALADKLNPDAAGYIGQKFNHFLPNALGIKPMIEYLVTHPDSLFIFMVVFTIIEGIVGLMLMLGFSTRLMSLGTIGLAMGILLGSGWIGTTCLDEWQIGVLGVAAGFVLFFSGSGPYSIDGLFIKRNYTFVHSKWFRWIGSGTLPLSPNATTRSIVIGSALILFTTLYTNQYFHNGIWGKLHNKSIKPKIEISDAHINKGELRFTIYRTEGVDVYGSFLIGISLSDHNGTQLLKMDGETLAKFPVSGIDNYYIAQVKPGKHSLIIPLGSKADISIRHNILKDLPRGSYTLTLTDISGITWQHPVEY